MSAVEVYWAEDEPGRGACRLPESWHLLIWEGQGWRVPRDVNGYEIRKGGFSRAAFAPLETSRLRLVVELREGSEAAILEWRVR